MKTYIIEAIVTALSSIAHNGGEQNGVITQLRREKFMQPGGKVVDVPLISGNSTRGKMRDISFAAVLTGKNGEKIQVDTATFNLGFMGGSLESEGANKPLNLEKVRQMRVDLPMLSIFGCSIGNIILPGKIKVGKMYPVCKEIQHLLPEKVFTGIEVKSIWDLCQTEMYTRKDDQKDEHLREYLSDAAKEGEKVKAQMQYYTETIAAGTRFYWKICIEDATDTETGAFLDTLNKFAQTPYVLGGNGRVGLGDIKMEIISTSTIDSAVDFKNDDFVKYIETYEAAKPDMTSYFETEKCKELFA